MDPRRRAALLAALFGSLLALHLWLLQRTIARGDAVLSGLLVAAILLFVNRVVHYGLEARRVRPTPVETQEAELRRLRVWAPILAASLPLHAWLFVGLLAAGELAFAVLVAVALVSLTARLARYAVRYVRLRRTVEAPR